MKFRGLRVCLLLFLFSGSLEAFSLDREAFTFTHYDLQVRVEPEQQRLGVRGKVTLRNDSAIPQKIAVLQISSSLDWRSIKRDGKLLQFVSQPFTSDIDHTGTLSEAIVTLSESIVAKGTVELEVAYEGVVVLDAARLTRIGTPESTALSTDWDQISTKFTALRGTGYVTWYPIATESADIAEGNNLSQVVGRWKARHAESAMNLLFESTLDETILCNGSRNLFAVAPEQDAHKVAAFSVLGIGKDLPTFALANYQQVHVKGISTVSYLPGYEAVAKSYAEAMTGLDPIPTATGPRQLQVVQIPIADAKEFVAGSMLIAPFSHSPTEENRLTLVYAVARLEIQSSRSWIVEGLAHYAQVLDIEDRRGRLAALDYLNAHSGLLKEFERNISSADAFARRDNDIGRSQSLINSTDEIYLQSKAMWVCWMLRDLLEGRSLSLILFNYKPAEDKEPSYLPRLIQAQTQRDLEWFFDDWVYRDRGLPDFKVKSEFTRKTLPEGYVLTITVDNSGAAGAEVPLTVKFAGGEVTKRLVVRGKSNAVIRVQVPKLPLEIVVNDGSVPESDTTNNVYKVDASAIEKQQM